MDNNEDKIFRNALRLACDAKLLASYERYPTAYAIATLALEELGKILLARWKNSRSLPKRQENYHVQKQCAVKSLLMAGTTDEQFRQKLMSAEDDDGCVDELVRIYWNSSEGENLRSAKQQYWERMKQFAFYADDNSAFVSSSNGNFVIEDVSQIFEDLKLATLLMDDIFFVVLGHAIYERQWNDPIQP